MSNIALNKEFIKSYMTKHDVKSMTQLAKEIGISDATLSKVMSGSRNPGPKVIAKMIQHFGTEFEKVFFYHL